MSYSHVYIGDEEYLSTLVPELSRSLTLFRYSPVIFSIDDKLVQIILSGTHPGAANLPSHPY